MVFSEPAAFAAVRACFSAFAVVTCGFSEATLMAVFTALVAPSVLRALGSVDDQVAADRKAVVRALVAGVHGAVRVLEERV